eukprot:CAMPEP_0172746736 /NCGR_PEP_ID=MMETSP1074-20121228/141320_1 /TAXON_ID=2916 /ORGANISM="Ceratium fusus, Strain PA161109" /LENGTH=32 /DNA_ID= /DNA_START= /DNA_END= /DNA_ORIENTATION=
MPLTVATFCREAALLLERKPVKLALLPQRASA